MLKVIQNGLTKLHRLKSMIRSHRGKKVQNNHKRVGFFNDFITFYVIPTKRYPL